MTVSNKDRYAFIKSALDAHTLGISAAVSLLEGCGQEVIIAPAFIEEAVDRIDSEYMQRLIIDWLRENKTQHIGFSYRLDTSNAIDTFGKFVYILKKNKLFESDNAPIKSIFFAGLPNSCEYIKKEYSDRIKTFKGGENATETLLALGIPLNIIPNSIISGNEYDNELLKFGREIINKADYKNEKPLPRNIYPEFGTDKDSLLKRLENNFVGGFQPLIRAHSGPYSSDVSREECVKQYKDWCRNLAESGYLDILSIGSSQLSQSRFGEKWGDRKNGGGVPVNSVKEYHEIWEASKPMLVRTYSGTKNVLNMAKMYEQTINMAWNALSLWWFDELDGRGENSLYNNLKEHIETIKYIASLDKPFEANVSHHFSFRGCDDATYIVSAYLSAKIAKKLGVKHFILQNMLNTPRSTWGIQDLAKSRVLIKLVKSLQDKDFRVILQTRAGLDYFKPDLDEAKIQLAAVTAQMDDIEPNNNRSPEIIHVVSYSEALYLANPEIINDSIKITRNALKEYREKRKKGETPDVLTDEIKNRCSFLESESIAVIKAMEENISNLYSPEGLYVAFVAGWLPVPYLWSESDEFKFAKDWKTKLVNGGISLVENGLILSCDSRINRCVSNMGRLDVARF